MFIYLKVVFLESWSRIYISRVRLYSVRIPTEPYSATSDFLDKFNEIATQIQAKIYKSYLRNKKNYDASRKLVVFEEKEKVFLRNYIKSDAIKGISKKLAP